VFAELMPLLAGRTVLITVAKIDDKTLRVNVIPHAKPDENPALTTPLTYTGPPEELDAQLGKHLAGYVMLAKALVELNIAVPGDWKRAEHDPTSFTRLTLERWIDTHGGSAIRHRFLLSAVISNTPCDWAERDETRPNQLFLIVEPSEATCGCAKPMLRLQKRNARSGGTRAF